MTVLTRSRRRVGCLAVLGVGLAAVLAPPSSARADDGPAPQPREHRVIAGVHTDAVSTFLDDGRLTLASKADVEEGNGTRFAASDIRFHVADDAKMSVPAGYEFIAPAGSEVWIAPESNPGPGRLWPGFSTESVPAGAIEGNQTTFTLTGVEGPGSLELFTTGGFGGAKRLWSSDDAAVREFAVGRTHMHANWAFTAAGTYEVGVRAAVTVAGQRQTAAATYTFVVGGLSAAVETTTALTASATTLVAGDDVTLSATVTPAQATGFVEFLDGGNVLGHSAVAGGRAAYEVSSLPLGSRSLTARFVPHVLNEFARSTSAPVVVTVTEEAGGALFGITGLAARYAAGERIDLGVTGATLGEGEKWRWLIRPAGLTTSFSVGSADRFVRDATVSLNGADIRVQVRKGSTTVQESAWLPIRVDGPNVGTGEPITVDGLKDSYYGGDPVRVSVAHRALAAGETTRWVSRYVPGGPEWRPVTKEAATGGLLSTQWLNSQEWAFEIVAADGTVVGRSPAFTAEIKHRELLLSGIRAVYRAGDTLRAESELFPVRDDVTYEWALISGADWTPIPGATGPGLELPVTADLNGKTLYLSAVDATTGHHIAGAQKELRVTDAPPGAQLLVIEPLSDHYHQGNPVKLTASADPVASDTDTYAWFWKRADQAGFTAMEGVTGAAHELRAEQALDGTQVRAELRSAAGELLATSEPATIHVDDHGAAPQQKVTVDSATLTASVTPASVLTRWEWHVRQKGAETTEVVEGQHGPRLSLPGAAYDGATVFARLTFDDGRPYVESAPVVWQAPATEPEPAVAGKEITASIGAADGALVISVDPADRAVTLPEAALSAAGDRWESTGALKPVTVTDTRTGQPGWTASGQIPDGFRTAAGEAFTGANLGWTPTVVRQGEGQRVAAGPQAALGDSAVLATAPDGAGRGTARLDAELTLSVPTETAAGTYTATLTLTAI